MINETKLQIPDEYKEKIQVIYKDKDGYWAYLGYGWCWKEKELHLIYACSEQDFIEEIKQIKACDCDFCEWQDVQRKEYDRELVDESDKNMDGKYRYEINCMYEIELENGEIINVYEDEINPDYKGDYTE